MTRFQLSVGNFFVPTTESEDQLSLRIFEFFVLFFEVKIKLQK